MVSSHPFSSGLSALAVAFLLYACARPGQPVGSAGICGNWRTTRRRETAASLTREQMLAMRELPRSAALQLHDLLCAFRAAPRTLLRQCLCLPPHKEGCMVYSVPPGLHLAHCCANASVSSPTRRAAWFAGEEDCRLLTREQMLAMRELPRSAALKLHGLLCAPRAAPCTLLRQCLCLLPHNEGCMVCSMLPGLHLAHCCANASVSSPTRRAARARRQDAAPLLLSWLSCWQHCQKTLI